MAVTDPKDTVYNSRSLSKWFAIASIILLIVTVWVVIEDYDRDWKRYSRQEHEILARLAQTDMKAVNKSVDQKNLDQVKADIAKLQKEQNGLTTELDGKIAHRDAVFYKINQTFQFAKANLDAELYTLNHSIEELKPDVAELKAEYQHHKAEVRKLMDAATLAEDSLNQAKDEKAKFLKSQKEANDKLEALTADQTRLEKIIAANEVSVGNLVRNAPLVDFISPTVKINQIILPSLKDNYNFNKVPRVDRCMTCHANINKAGFEDMPQPFKSHPNLKLYMSPDSAHPVEKIGCTVCHSGVPQSVDFALAGHTPRDLIQENEWVEKYHFHRPHHLPTPMLPLQMTEGQCIQCHAKQVHLDGAPTFNAGMRIIERYGCYTCHKFQGHFEELAKEKKPAPSLQKIASKITPDFMKKFIWDPKTFRPTALMPRFWKNDNNSDPVSIARGLVEVDAITQFIFSKSKPFEPIKLASSVVGDATRGKEIVGSVGCLACHAVKDFPRKNPDEGTFGYKDPRVPMFGPELNQSGSKLNKEWLVSWLINPKHYWEGSGMPSMKLSPQEAADTAEYLLSKHNEQFEAIKLLNPSDVVRDAIVQEYFEKLMTKTDAKVKLASMSLNDKKAFLGQKLVEHYGCYGCHAIEGYEHGANVGPELTYEGSKDITKFDFGNVNIEHSRHDWVLSKVRNPRIWDVGRNIEFDAKVKMPNFGFTVDQANAVASIVLGYGNKNVDDEAIMKIDGRKEAVIAGERQMVRHNCVGCHNFEKPQGWGAEVLAHYQTDITMGPPNLNTEGQKIQTDWLYSFLLNPNVKIRPWLKIRMPQFWMNETEAMNYTKYFAAHDSATYPYVIAPYNKLNSDQISQAKQLVTTLACLTCHGERAPGKPVDDAAPHFRNIKARLRGPWVVDWVHDPQAIMPGTRMPTLFPLTNTDDPKSPRMGVPGILGGDAEKQIPLLRDYLFQFEGPAEVPTSRGDMREASAATVSPEVAAAPSAVKTAPSKSAKKAKAR